MKKTFGACQNHIDEFKDIIKTSNCKYFSVDMTELFYFIEDPNEFFGDIQNILSSFDNSEFDCLEQLLRMADIQKYDQENSDFIPNEFLNYKYHLVGVKCS